MKIMNLNQILLKENRRFLLSLVCLVFILCLLYLEVCNSSTDGRKILFVWFGSTVGQIYSFSILVLKMCFVSITFIYIGRIIEQLKSNFIYYLAPRLGNIRRVVVYFAFPIILQGVILAVVFELAFFIAVVIYANNFNLLITIINQFISYTIIECISMIGVILIYMILEFVFAINNSILIIVTLYLINSIVPYNFPIAIFTSRLGNLYYNGGIAEFGFIVCISTLLIACIFIFFIRKKEIKLC